MKIITALLASALLASAAKAENPVVVMKTNKGEITIELNKEKAPITVANFLKYVGDQHYDGTIFHRVIDGFMIQGGGFAAGVSSEEDEPATPEQKKSLAPIKNEAKTAELSNLRGTIAMARTNDPDSATAQFFINVKDNKNLDAGGFSPDGYAVFGKVTSGMDTVDKIKVVKTAPSPLKSLAGDKLIERPTPDVPVEPVIIESVALKGAAGADAGTSTEKAPAAPAE